MAKIINAKFIEARKSKLNIMRGFISKYVIPSKKGRPCTGFFFTEF